MNSSPEDAEYDTPILENPDICRDLVTKMRTYETLHEILQYFLDKRPADLCFGSEHYLNLREIEEHISGLCLKFKIHGYDDRGDRLQYLFSTLSQKYDGKEETLKILVQFLINIGQRPTAVTHLELKTDIYSTCPDGEDFFDDDSEKQRALLLKLLYEERDIDDDDTEMKYSSDSELSEWSTDEDNSPDENSNNDLPPIVKVRHSSSFGEFSDIITTSAEGTESLRQEVQLYWSQQKYIAEKYLGREIRKFAVHPLRNQPVISSLLVLQSRFGEFWEWKQHKKEKQDLSVAFEEDVVREILWQFTISKPDSSPVFTPQWELQSHLMVSTLSKSSFSSIMSDFGNMLSKLQKLRKFADAVLNRIEDESCNSSSFIPSKVLRNYASSLLEISHHIVGCISDIERKLNRKSRLADDGDKEPACTTLIQLRLKSKDLNSIINLLYDIYRESGFQSSNESESNRDKEEPWLYSLKLASCLESHLLLETRPYLYGVLLFQYSKCVQAFLDDIISTLRTMKWDESHSLFVRDRTVKLNDSNFWSECIKIRDYKTLLRSSGISPLMCLDKLLPKVLNILKTSEVLDQLEEDFTQILSKSNVLVSDVIFEFIEQTFSVSTISEKPFPTNPIKDTACAVNYMQHFSLIGLKSSYAIDAFQFLTSTIESMPVDNNVIKQHKFKDFLNFSMTPLEAHTAILDKVLDKWFGPFSICAKESIQKIFQDYKVLESLRVFQEIILTVREDFARAIIEIASDQKRSEVYTYEDSLNRNPRFQKLLNECYPEGRDIFSVDLRLDHSSDMNCSLIITPHFPLNLIVTPQSVAGYLFIGRQLHRIRKSVWNVSSLSMKDCVASDDVEIIRLLMFRFSLINFCSSLRSFFTLKLFSKDFSQFVKSASCEDEDNLDSIRRIHEEYLESIKTRMLRNPLIETIIIRKVVQMSDALRDNWSVGISQTIMLTLEDTLKKCWRVVNDFESTKYSFDFNELSYHFGPPPAFLNNL